jgi:hypothetical protein
MASDAEKNRGSTVVGATTDEPRAKPISLHPLSVEDVLRALANTPPMTAKPKRQTSFRNKKLNRRKDV